MVGRCPCRDGHMIRWPDDRLVWIEGGTSHTGTNRPEIKADGEAPRRRARLSPYGMATTTVSNADFQSFVEDTGYITQAESIGWSFVFRGLIPEQRGPSPENLPWWNGVEGASWKSPLGPTSNLDGLEDHPVVHVSELDARAFADWAGGRLPTEPEWEHAARGGAEPRQYPWGEDEPSDQNARHCNIWQGTFPTDNTEADGFFGTAPFEHFAPNAFGLYQMSGNVWEWCADRFRVRSVSKAAKTRNQVASREDERVLKGGSFLCHASYCWRYRIAARSGRAPDNATSNCGFRLAFDSQLKSI